MQLHFWQVFSVCGEQETHPLLIGHGNTNFHEGADSGFYQPTFFSAVQKQHPWHTQFYHFSRKEKFDILGYMQNYKPKPWDKLDKHSQHPSHHTST